MSHYSVLAIMPEGTSKADVQEVLEREMAPYMENCCGTPDKMFMKFFDTEDEYREKYENTGVIKVVMPDGRLLDTWDNEFKPKSTKEDPFPRAKPPENLAKKEVPFKELYSDFDEFMKEWAGYKKDETYQRYGYWQNPQAKWDWYEIGGRWAGFFQLKNGTRGLVGSQYNMAQNFPVSADKADICFKRDVDFESMRKEAEDAAAKRYDMVQEAIEGLPVAESWELIRSDFNLEEPGAIEKARDRYHGQERVVAFRTVTTSEKGRELFGWMTNVDEYQVPREQYLRQARNHAAVPFAFLKDGKWCEQGEMGWWGMASNEKDPETWNAMYAKLIDELPDNTLLVVVDAHI